MKKIIILLITALITFTSYSQISATTSSGKNVMLNTDGTWKYADANTKTDEKPCTQFHTGNLTIKNNTHKDIYFYYHYQGVYSMNPSFVKIKADSLKTIKALTSGQEMNWGKEQYRYAWKATLESQRSDIYISSMEGIEAGNFVINDCETTEIEVDN